jgi:ADP-ribosylglycohydrolase
VTAVLGAIAGDIIGSVYEADNVKSPDFEPLFQDYCRPTDDTVLTLAVAEWIIDGAGDDLSDRLKQWFGRYPMAGYGGSFIRWAGNVLDHAPYGSWGNGSAMRASPVGFAFETIDEVLVNAKRSAEVTHDHPEGIKGAQATAAAVFLARRKKSKDEIRDFIERTFKYDLNFTLDAIRPTYTFDVSCQGSVPQAIRAFLESENYEDAVRKAISIGGDSDTIACIAGGIAHAYYGPLPKMIEREVFARINDEMEEVIDQFVSRFPSAR